MNRHYSEAAAGLRQLADRVEILAADAPDLPRPSFDITVMPGGGGKLDARDNDVVIEAIDAVATALFGVAGSTNRLSGGSFHRGARGAFGPVRVHVFDEVRDPDGEDLRAEVARLRAQLAEREEHEDAAVVPSGIQL